jgi:uncharacterized protein involved in exopolysaccharide biosynthesis
MTSVRTAPVDLDAEREIDLSRWRDAVVRRWWIVASGLVGGIVVGALYSLGGGSVWEASTLLAPGQAFSPNGSPVLVYQASPRSINDIATSESALKEAAAKAHTSVEALRGHVSTQNVSTGLGPVAARGSTLVRITVRLHKPKAAAVAANALGQIVQRDTTSPYVRESIKTYESRIRSYTKQLAPLQTLIDQYNKTLATLQLDPFNKLILVSQVDNAVLRLGTLNDKLSATQAQLTLVQNIEISQIISTASAVKTTARSRRNSILIGGLIGLILGVISAIVADPRLPQPR